MEPYDVDEVYNCTNAIITYLTNGIPTKLPMKEEDIRTAINIKGELFRKGLQNAKVGLQETFGIVIKEVPGLKSGKAYIAVNEDTTKSIHMFDQEQQSQLTLLFLVLSYLLMRGSSANQDQCIAEDELVNFLSGLNIFLDSHHEYFGPNIKKLMTETFIKQLYLKREKVISDLGAEVKFLYSWGFRAHMEFDKQLVVEAVAKIMKKPPTFFEAKYQEVCQDNISQMDT